MGCIRAGGDAVVVLAAQMLAARGDRSALAHLDRAARRRDLDPNTIQRLVAARVALYEQLGGAQAIGGLALADEQPAQLSLAEDAQEGRLSVAASKTREGK